MGEKFPTMSVLPLAAAQRVDDLCRLFEGAWKAGQRPRLGVGRFSLTGVPEPEFSVLLRELLILDVAYRSARPRLERYYLQFPAHILLIDEVVRAAAGGPDRPPPARETADNDATLAPGSVPAPSEAGAVSVPGYEVLGELGHGGMGVVYKARQVKLKRYVALKMIQGLGGPTQLARFQREAAVLARLRHPHIVQIHEMGDHEGRPYFSLEYLPGNLGQKLAAQKLAGQRMSSREAAQLLHTLADTVAYAHRCGVVHRDLKPANVLFAEDGTPKIADFGLAKVLERATSGLEEVWPKEPGTESSLASLRQGPELTLCGAVLGTPKYMAPEQAEGNSRNVKPAMDIYALGVILYELLTGQPPFKAPTGPGTLEQVRTQEPVPPSRLQPEVPAALEAICLKCLQKEPGKRYASAKLLAEALNYFLDDRPVPVAAASPALPPTTAPRPRRSAWMVLSLLVLSGALGVVSWKWLQAEVMVRKTEDRYRNRVKKLEEEVKKLKDRANDQSAARKK